MSEDSSDKCKSNSKPRIRFNNGRTAMCIDIPRGIEPIGHKRTTKEGNANPEIFGVASSLGDGSTELSVDESRAHRHERRCDPCREA